MSIFLVDNTDFWSIIIISASLLNYKLKTHIIPQEYVKLVSKQNFCVPFRLTSKLN